MNALLAFDTATARTHVGLAVGARSWHREGEGGAKASAVFLPAVLGLLDEAGIAVADLDAIAFGRGPGAFTGLRVACAVAQGLALGAAKPVLPIDTLLAVAEDARAGAATFRVWAVMDARMNELYAAEYGYAAGRWQALTAPMLTSAAALAEVWARSAPQVVAGNGLLAVPGALETGSAERLPGAEPRGPGLLSLARLAWADGGAVDAAAALPLYLRDKVALTSAERAARVPA